MRCILPPPTGFISGEPEGRAATLRALSVTSNPDNLSNLAAFWSVRQSIFTTGNPLEIPGYAEFGLPSIVDRPEVLFQ
jgi:hypothetical protein